MAGEGVQVELSQEVFDDLKELAARRGVSVEDALRDALASGVFILRETANGNKILIRRGASLEELTPA